MIAAVPATANRKPTLLSTFLGLYHQALSLCEADTLDN
jgi:hypothetical protein